MTIKEQISAADALAQFKTGMAQLATAMKAAGRTTPTQAAKAPSGAQPSKETGGTAPSVAPGTPGAKQPASGATATASSVGKAIKIQDFAKKAQEFGIEPNKAIKLFQHYGIELKQ